jgi:hypothetical protein
MCVVFGAVVVVNVVVVVAWARSCPGDQTALRSLFSPAEMTLEHKQSMVLARQIQKLLALCITLLIIVEVVSAH